MTPETRPESGDDSALERARARLSEARECLANAERALGEADAKGGAREEQPAAQTAEPSWRERLWSGPSEARIGVEELADAVGRSTSWVYQRTRSDADNPIPHAKLGGALTFRCGEVRAWVRDVESVEVAGRSDPPADALELVEDRRTA